MGSIISSIEDKIKEHGSFEKYKEHLSKTAFIPHSTVPPKPYPVFKDSEGNEVRDGMRIKILKHLTSCNYNGCESIVRWSTESGRYEFQSPFINGYLGFALIKKFVVIGH